MTQGQYTTGYLNCYWLSTSIDSLEWALPFNVNSCQTMFLGRRISVEWNHIVVHCTSIWDVTVVGYKHYISMIAILCFTTWTHIDQ